MKTITQLTEEGRPSNSTIAQNLFDTMTREGKIYCQLENISIVKQYIIALINKVTELEQKIIEIEYDKKYSL